MKADQILKKQNEFATPFHHSNRINQENFLHNNLESEAMFKISFQGRRKIKRANIGIPIIGRYIDSDTFYLDSYFGNDTQSHSVQIGSDLACLASLWTRTFNEEWDETLEEYQFFRVLNKVTCRDSMVILRDESGKVIGGAIAILRTAQEIVDEINASLQESLEGYQKTISVRYVASLMGVESNTPLILFSDVFMEKKARNGPVFSAMVLDLLKRFNNDDSCMSAMGVDFQNIPIVFYTLKEEFGRQKLVYRLSKSLAMNEIKYQAINSYGRHIFFMPTHELAFVARLPGATSLKVGIIGLLRRLKLSLCKGRENYALQGI